MKRTMAMISALALFVVAGCANLESDVEPDWVSDARAGGLADSDVSLDDSRLVIDDRDSMVILDSEDGDALGVLGDDPNFPTLIQGPDVPVQPDADHSNIVVLPEAGLLLFLDFESLEDRITAIDLETGDMMWVSRDHEYSIQRFEGIIGEVRDRAAQTLASAFGGTAQTESAYAKRSRQRRFARNLAETVDDGDAFLFKTFDGLAKIDTETSQTIWQIEEFKGPGLQSVQILDDGDYLVASTGENLSDYQVATAYHLARISPEGELRWLAEHNADGTRGLGVSDETAVVYNTPVEGFDLETGEKVWENEYVASGGGGADDRYLPEPSPMVTDDAVYQAMDILGEDGAPSIAINIPPHRIRSYDSATGELRWETDKTDTYFGPLDKEGDTLIVWGAGELFGDGGAGIAGLDANTGEVLWKSPEVETPGFFMQMAEAEWYADPAYGPDGETMFIAGQYNLVGVDVISGETLFDVDLSDNEIGQTMWLTTGSDNVAVIGRDGIAGYDMADGSQQYEHETDYVRGYRSGGDRVALLVQARMLAGMAESDERGLVPVDIDTGDKGELAVYHLRGSSYGPLSNSVYLASNGSDVYTFDEDGYLIQYSLW